MQLRDLTRAVVTNTALARRSFAILRRFGMHVAPGPQPTCALLHMLKITRVLDVGANVGQYGRRLRILGYDGQIVSFEPTAGAFVELSKRASRDARWHVVQIALGDYDGIVRMNVAEQSQYSSALEGTDSLSHQYAGSGYVRVEEVPIHRLDSILGEHASRDDRLLLKIDTQGLEPQVLAGAAGVWDAIAAIHLELSFRRLYESEMLSAQMIATLAERGFTLVHLEPLHHGLANETLHQADGFFVKM